METLKLEAHGLRGQARITRMFLFAGGRLLVSVTGEPEARMDMSLIYGLDVDEDLAENRAFVTRAMLDTIQMPVGRAFAKRAARAAGIAFADGYLLPREAQP